ncbi:MAG: APC family permease, partial [Verrucomicrobia bacterium]|nr:APC family permease [Verrucomicrobiota bacterium]
MSASPPTAKPTLGLTGLTMNAMALIAPGAFLWLTFAQQCQYGAPMAGSAMWFGIIVALLLCFATALCYAELSKLYPGAGSSYVFAEQAFLSKTKASRFARIAKFTVGWASHLYYWVYPGVMVGVTAILVGYLAGQLWPSVFNAAVPSPLLMILFAIVFPFGVGYIAYRGVTGVTAVNIAINVVQITALVVFAVIAIGYRLNHGTEGSKGITLNPDGVPVSKVIAMSTTKDDKGNDVTNPVKDKDGNYVFEKNTDGSDKDFTLSYSADQAITKGSDPKNPTDTFQFHQSAISVVSPHNLSFVLVQACIAILILVGFESVTSMGEEAKNAKRDIPRAVLLSLLIQGVICYLFEYFAANYFLNSGYTMTTAAGSPAPIGDMMQIVGTWLFGSAT